MTRGTQGGSAYPVTITGTEVNGVLVDSNRSRIYPYTKPRTGELIASSAAGTGSKQCPDIPCDMVKFVAYTGNVGNINIGWNAGVTISDGVADTSTGLIIAPGQELAWIPVANMNLLYYIAANAGDRLTYMTVSP